MPSASNAAQALPGHCIAAPGVTGGRGSGDKLPKGAGRRHSALLAGCACSRGLRRTGAPKHRARCGAQASISVTDNGSLKLVSRSQLYRFTPEGLECNPSTSGRLPAQEQHSYKARRPSLGGLAQATLPAAEGPLSAGVTSAPLKLVNGQQISERDVRILRVLGRGASSVVRPVCPGAESFLSLPSSH